MSGLAPLQELFDTIDGSRERTTGDNDLGNAIQLRDCELEGALREIW